MVDKIWEIKPRKFDDLIDQLLFNRGIIKSADDKTAIEQFFEPDFARDLPDPYLMKNLPEAVERIKLAIEKGEKIGIFSDYDADGIPGAALLYKALKQLNVEPVVYIPDRTSGYGLSEYGLNYLKEEGCKLVITIDLGIRSLAEARFAKKIGLDLIITDHHLPGDELPAADLVINPKQKGDRYPEPNLCGCAVAFKLVQGLGKIYPKKLDEKFLKWNLDLVAISTISDVVPLSGENRLLAHYGLIVLSKTKNLGLSELIKVAKIEPKKMGAYTVGFQLGPRINAPGRIAKAAKSFELLTTEDKAEAKELALWLNEKNEERQEMMDVVEREAIEYVEKNKLEKDKIIIARGAWAKGVIGPTASRLCEKYARPVILFADDGEVYTGSARSISGINIVDIFEKIKAVLKKYGGHAGAAGVSVEKKKYDKFILEIQTAAEKDIEDKDLVKKIRIDAEVEISEINKKLYEKILRFEPFGMGNPRPNFVLKDVELCNTRFVGRDENHLQGRICSGESQCKIIHFSFPYDKSMIVENAHYDLAFSINLDEWNGRSELCLNVVDIKSK